MNNKRMDESDVSASVASPVIEMVEILDGTVGITFS